MSDRKVHFSSPIHRIEYLDKQWETASRLARDGSDWLRMSLDRQRFRDRIERTGEILNRILDFDFRQRIHKERFENIVFTSEQQATSDNSATTAEQSIESSNASQQQEELNQQSPLTQQQQRQQQTSNNTRGRRRGKRNNKRRKHRRGHNKKN